MPTESMVRVNLKLTQAVHRLFKAWCAEQGVTLQVGVERAVKGLMKAKVGGAALMGAVEVAPGVWGMPGAPDMPSAWETTAGVGETSAPAAATTAPKPETVEEEDEAARQDREAEEERLAFDPETHYREVRAKGLSERSAVEDTRRAIEWYTQRPGSTWVPAAAGASNGAKASPESAGPITSKTHEVPGGWVDRSGETRRVNLERYGEDESIEYYPS